MSINNRKRIYLLMKLNNEIKDLENKIQAYQEQLNSANVEQQYQEKIQRLNQELLSVYKERIKVANDINIKSLNKIHIEDKKSTANDVFKWIIASIYNEPENKFFWPNFKEEAFENDKGRDFIERLGKINATKEEHKLKTEYFLQNYSSIASAKELQEHRSEIDKIQKIGELFKSIYTIQSNIKDNENLIAKYKESTVEKDEEFMRWRARSDALKDRIQTNESYLNVLENVSAKLQTKVSGYQQIIDKGSELMKDFSSFDKWTPVINLGEEHKSNCECTLF